VKLIFVSELKIAKRNFFYCLLPVAYD